MSIYEFHSKSGQCSYSLFLFFIFRLLTTSTKTKMASFQKQNSQWVTIFFFLNVWILTLLISEIGSCDVTIYVTFGLSSSESGKSNSSFIDLWQWICQCQIQSESGSVDRKKRLIFTVSPMLLPNTQQLWICVLIMSSMVIPHCFGWTMFAWTNINVKDFLRKNVNM